MRELGLGITDSDLAKINISQNADSRAGSSKNSNSQLAQDKNGKNEIATSAPKELVSACSNLASGDSCSFAGFNNTAATGICAQVGDKLMCRGNNLPALRR
jgi:hypothetical protein